MAQRGTCLSPTPARTRPATLRSALLAESVFASSSGWIEQRRTWANVARPATGHYQRGSFIGRAVRIVHRRERCCRLPRPQDKGGVAAWRRWSGHLTESCTSGRLTGYLAHMSDRQGRATSAAAARAARAAEQSRRDTQKKQKKALRATIADARQQQKDLRRHKDELRRMEQTAARVRSTLRRSARLGAASVITGPGAGRLPSSTTKHASSAKPPASIRGAIKTIDQQMKRAIEAERGARNQLRNV